MEAAARGTKTPGSPRARMLVACRLQWNDALTVGIDLFFVARSGGVRKVGAGTRRKAFCEESGGH